MRTTLFVAAFAVAFALAYTPSHSQSISNVGDHPVSTHAKGTFDVKITPNGTQEGDAGLAKLLVQKTFHGDLEATSKGEMLTGDSTRKDSGVYVLIERVSGTLNGRKGSFILHHNGIMDRGTPHLDILVAPDSGTDDLTGLTGRLGIEIKDGKHYYDLDYSLPAAPSTK